MKTQKHLPPLFIFINNKYSINKFTIFIRNFCYLTKKRIWTLNSLIEKRLSVCLSVDVPHCEFLYTLNITSPHLNGRMEYSAAKLHVRFHGKFFPREYPKHQNSPINIFVTSVVLEDVTRPDLLGGRKYHNDSILYISCAIFSWFLTVFIENSQKIKWIHEKYGYYSN